MLVRFHVNGVRLHALKSLRIQFSQVFIEILSFLLLLPAGLGVVLCSHDPASTSRSIIFNVF